MSKLAPLLVGLIAVSPTAVAANGSVRVDKGLAEITARHGAGQDVRRDLVTALTRILPGGRFYRPVVVARPEDGKTLILQKEAPSDGTWLHLHAAEKASF